MTPDTLAILIAYLLGTFALGLAIGFLYDQTKKDLRKL
jgi:hypothetical protein